MWHTPRQGRSRDAAAASREDLTIEEPTTAVSATASPLAVEAAKVRNSLGRSNNVLRLFDYLVEQTLAGRTPKEVEFAQDVFGRDADFDDGSVRVYIHRLRKKLDGLYQGRSGPHLYIPKGEYRLAYGEVVGMAPPSEEEPPGKGHVLRRGRWLFLAGLLFLLAMLITTLLLPSWQSDRHSIEQSVLWRPMNNDGRPIFVVSGDYYVFGELRENARVVRVIRDPAINSAQDLNVYLLANPTQKTRLADVDLSYLPGGLTDALGRIVPLASRLGPYNPARPIMMNMSRFEGEVLRDSDVVFVGRLDALGALTEPVFASSGFQPGAMPGDLIDRRTGRHFTADPLGTNSEGKSRRDYAYLAMLPGSSGNRILILSGMRDAAVRQIAQIATDPKELRALEARIGAATGFEALYEVHAMGDLNLGSTLVVARPLEHNGLLRQKPASAVRQTPAIEPEGPR